MKSLRIALMGANGRVGKEITALLEKTPNIKLSALLDFRNTQPVVNSKLVDVVVDFSSPEGFISVLDWCVKNKKPLVSGTTGLQTHHFKKARAASKKIPILISPNMGLGINIVGRLVENILKTSLPESIFISETHHIHKKDKPSGTAKFLFETAEKHKKKSTTILPIESIREGEALGTHSLHFQLDGEMIKIEHVAQSRQIFAQGALLAAEWLKKQRPRQYTMSDFLNRAGK